MEVHAMQTTLHETSISHLIKPEDLQHHGTLFAGQMAKWLVEALFIAACRFIGKPEEIVCVQIHGLSFTRPITNGDIVEIRGRVAYVGKKSVTCYGSAYCEGDSSPRVTGMATFVTMDKEGNAYEHGLSLPPEYVENNLDIYNRALAERKKAK
jgi:acyl-CoA hydrolase